MLQFEHVSSWRTDFESVWRLAIRGQTLSRRVALAVHGIDLRLSRPSASQVTDSEGQTGFRTMSGMRISAVPDYTKHAYSLGVTS
jgi:hypothetical protein